jgi:two-component system NtrC family sensor kinase
MEDVSERMRAQAVLVESEKLALTGRLAASLAHEINNPLQSVVGLLSLAEEDLAQGRDASQYVQIALEEVERAAELIARLRNLSRPQQTGERKPAEINALVERVLTLTQKKCQESQVKVEWAPGADLPVPWLACDHMQQVFMNLVLNAVDAMPDGGRLEVSTERTLEPPGVTVRFADSGMGISPEDLPHLFQPFYTTKSMGVGLGLYVSKQIVESHGGRIELESAPDKGTTFGVWVPLEEKES